MTPATYARLTRLALWSLAVIVVTGSAVRLTGSGLGCEDWPGCEEDRLVAHWEYHALIEFGNRLFTGVVALAVIAAVAGSVRRVPRRVDLNWLSWGLVAGVVAQVILGALLVETGLDPRFTLGHFLLSMVLLANATILDERARDSRDTVDNFDTSDNIGSDAAGRAAPPPLDSTSRHLIRAMLVISAGLLVSGAIVTGSGPHAGDSHAERLPLLVREVTRIHSLVAIALLAVVLITWLRLLRRPDPAAKGTPVGLRFWASRLFAPQARRLGRIVVLLVLQGTIGYAQYFAGVPALLVGIHVTLASLTWIEIVRVATLAGTGRLGTGTVAGKAGRAGRAGTDSASLPVGAGAPGLGVQP